MPILRRGSSGPDVAALQTALNASLVPSPNLTPDGQFGGLTDTAVRKFQTERRIASDGVVGPITECVLRGGRRGPPTIHSVQLVAQPTDSTCWAASTAMMKGSTPAAIIAKTPPEMIGKSGGLKNASDKADNVTENARYAAVHGLRYSPPQSYMVQAFVAMVIRSPVMLNMLWNAGQYSAGAGSPGHMIVVYGVDSDGQPDGKGTLLHVRDPWSPRIGKTTQVSYYKLANDTPCFSYGAYTR